MDHRESAPIRVNIKLKHGHEIESESMAEILSSFAKISQQINNSITPECQLKLHVAPPKAGSFIFDLFVSATAASGNTLFNHVEFLKYSKIAYTSIQGLIKLREFLKKDPPVSIHNNSDGTTTIVNGDNNQITINQNVYHLYTKPEMAQIINKALKTSFQDENATALTIGAPGKPDLSIDRKDLNNYLQPESHTSNVNEKIESDVMLWIVKPCFDSSLNWKFVYHGRMLGMKVTDEEFNKKVDSGESFQAGDQLIVNIKIKQKFSEKYNTYIDDSYEIIKVINHINRSDQEPLQIG